MHEPSVIDVVFGCTDDAYVDHGAAWTGASWEKTSTSKRVWHAGDQKIPLFKHCAVEFAGFLTCQISVRLIKKTAITNISQLYQPHLTLRILIFAFNPVAVRKYATGGYHLFQCDIPPV